MLAVGPFCYVLLGFAVLPPIMVYVLLSLVPVCLLYNPLYSPPPAPRLIQELNRHSEVAVNFGKVLRCAMPCRGGTPLTRRDRQSFHIGSY